MSDTPTKEQTEQELEQIEKLLDLFAHEGWPIFMSDMEKNLAAVNHVGSIAGEQQLGVRQGQVQALAGLLNYPTAIETARKQLIEDQAASDPEGEDA